MNLQVQLIHRRTYYLADLKRHKSGLLIWKIERWSAKRDPALPLVKLEGKRKMCEDYESITYQWLPSDVRCQIEYDFFPYKDGDLNPKGFLVCLKRFFSWFCSLGANRLKG